MLITYLNQLISDVRTYRSLFTADPRTEELLLKSISLSLRSLAESSKAQYDQTFDSEPRDRYRSVYLQAASAHRNFGGRILSTPEIDDLLRELGEIKSYLTT